MIDLLKLKRKNKCDIHIIKTTIQPGMATMITTAIGKNPNEMNLYTATKVNLQQKKVTHYSLTSARSCKKMVKSDLMITTLNRLILRTLAFTMKRLMRDITNLPLKFNGGRKSRVLMMHRLLKTRSQL